jgi:hypothetical protein
MLLASCAGETAEQADGGKPKVSSKPVKPPLPPPLRLRIVVPYGGNMPGFMAIHAKRGVNTAFQKRIGQLIYDVRSSTAVSDRRFYLVDQTAHLNAYPADTVRGRINGTKPTGYGVGIGVAELLRSALTLPNSEKIVTVIATDLVDHSAVRMNLAALEDDITHTLAEVKLHSLSVSVYADVSPFYGPYYPAFQDKVKSREVAGTELPYYLWVIGPPAQVARFNQAVFQDAPERQAHFGVSAKVPYAALMKAAPAPTGTIFPSDPPTNRKLTVEDVKEQPVEFTVGLNLEAVPAALRTPEALLALTLTAPHAQAKLAGPVQQLTAAQRATPVLAPYTHTVRLRLTSLNAPHTTLTLALPAPQIPSWVAALSTDDDRQPGLHTYRLATILKGVQAAQGKTPPDVFRCTLVVDEE